MNVYRYSNGVAYPLIAETLSQSVALETKRALEEEYQLPAYSARNSSNTWGVYVHADTPADAAVFARNYITTLLGA